MKRVIGIGGDTVAIKNGKVLVNGDELHEPYLSCATEGDLSWQIPSEAVYLLGDNRENSNDSRYWDFPFVPYCDILAHCINNI